MEIRPLLQENKRDPLSPVANTCTRFTSTVRRRGAAWRLAAGVPPNGGASQELTCQARDCRQLLLDVLVSRVSTARIHPVTSLCHITTWNDHFLR
jgi:hypothetical protein